MSEDGGGGQMMIMVVMMAAAVCCCSSVGGLGYAYTQNWLCECCQLCKSGYGDGVGDNPPAPTDTTPTTPTDDTPDGSSKDKDNTSYDTLKARKNDEGTFYIQPYKCRSSTIPLGAWKALGRNLTFPKVQLKSLNAADKTNYSFVDKTRYILTKKKTVIDGKVTFDTSKYRTWKVEKGANNTVHFKTPDGKYLAAGDGCSLDKIYIDPEKKKSTRNMWTIRMDQLPNS